MHHFRYLDRPVIYADFGSNDPIFTSNTFFLDFCMKASGVCVEANPQFTQRYSAYRSCKLTNTCLSNETETVTFAVQAKDFSTRSGVLSTNKNGKLNDVIEMECTTGAKVFREAGIVHVDWLDLDAEGHEWHILKGIDFSEVVIDIISVEANHKHVAKYLQGIGYRTLGKFHYDNIYLREGFELLDKSSNIIDDCV